MAENLSRNSSRYAFFGLNTRSQADSLPPEKYPVAINVRGYGASSVRTRPGYVLSFTGSGSITDLRSYSATGTDNLPRIVAHNSSGNVFVDSLGSVGTVGTGGLGASMISYRPNQSPQAWMYVANATGYKKFSAPSGSTVTAQKVGIAEPQTAPGACPDGLQYNDFASNAAGWAAGGTAGAPADATRSTDTAVAIFADNASVSPATKTRYSVQVGTGVQYQLGETLSFATGATPILAVVEDVVPPVSAGNVLTIKAIYYLSGSTGQCVVVPSQLPIDPSNPNSTSFDPLASNPFLPGQIAGLRRGSLIQFAGGTPEVCLVQAVTTGPDGSVAFEVSTVNTHAAGENLNGKPAIVVSGINNTVVGNTVTAAQINSAIATGVGTLTQTLGTNPFNVALGTLGVPQVSDFVHVSMLVDNPSNLTELKIMFDVSDGLFTGNFLYYSVRVGALQAAVSNATTTLAAIQNQAQQDLVGGLGRDGSPQQQNIDQQLARDSGQQSDSISSDPTDPTNPDVAATGTSQWTEVVFPISALIRVGDDQTQTLANCVKAQILANCSGAVNLSFGSAWVGGGGQPSVSDVSVPYFYRVRPRSSLTGAKGNPSPATRYGVFPSRQRVIVPLPSASYDTQIDTWDILRFGGSVLSWRVVGSASSTATSFADNVFDTALTNADFVDFSNLRNYEPWPSVDAPWIATVGAGGITNITVVGTAIKVLGSTFPATIASWLPGTLVTLNGQYAYTLQCRPTAISGGYLFRTIENAGFPTVTTLQVNEPEVANQDLPYVWGPDAQGIVYATGDTLRPGFFSSTEQFAPDSALDNSYDLVPPSEPLLGGEIVDGVPIVASAKRWWILRYDPSIPQRFIADEIPAGKGLAAPWGHCTDGKLEYFWAKDSICAMAPGSPAISLTDTDLWNLFTHGATPGANVTYGGYTFYAPDYSRASQFRLAVVNSVLKAHYRDSTGTPRTLVLDMSLVDGKPRMAWSSDSYNDPMTVTMQPEQPSGTLATTGTTYQQSYFADSSGKVYYEQDAANDNGVAITGVLGTFESDGGDAVGQKLWNDALLDVAPVSAVSVTPMSVGAAIATATVVSASASRTSVPVPIPVGVYSRFCGLLATWTDDFSAISSPTTFYIWEPAFVIGSNVLTTQNFRTAATSHGMKGYQHVREVRLAYSSTAAATLTITVIGGTSPTSIVIPSTSGARAKTSFTPTYNKGLLFQYVITCPTGSLRVWLEDCEFLIHSWNDTGEYSTYRGIVAA